jgi:hypothetical protein
VKPAGVLDEEDLVVGAVQHEQRRRQAGDAIGPEAQRG